MKSLLDWWKTLPPDTQEKLLIALISALLTAILTALIPKFIWPLLVRSFSWAKEQIYRRLAGLPLFNRWGVKRYKKSLRITLQRVSNPWSSQRLTLENIFVPIKVETKYNLPQLVPGQKAPEELVDLRSAAREYHRFVLVGDPGAGKSTALKNIGLAALDDRLYSQDKQVLPVYIELKRYSKSNLALDAYLSDTFKSFEFPNASKFIQRALSKGRLLLLLDGLDEVRDDNFAEVIGKIQEFCSQYSGTPLIVTCRTASYERQLDDLSAATVALTNFNNIQIVTFLRHWSYPPGKSSVDLMRILHDRPRILSICRNPLMLTIVTSLYIETDYELPSSRSEFYKTCIDAVLRRWDRARQVERHNKYSVPVKQRILQRLALHLQESSEATGDIDFAELVNFVAEVLPTVGLTANLAEDVINEIVLNSGLVLYVGPQRLRFAHLTFQEFFAAQEIDVANTSTHLLDNYTRDPKRWREVCLLYCGISGRSNDFISKLSTRDIVVAANCIADGEVLDTKLAEDIIDKLEARVTVFSYIAAGKGGDTKLAESFFSNLGDKIVAPEAVNQELNALSLLAADPSRVWAMRAFGIIKDFLHRVSDDLSKTTAITALANVPTEAAANELVAALLQEETRLVARQALVQLGPVGVPAIKRVLDSTPDVVVAQMCLEICAQATTPEVVDVLLPWLGHKDEVLSATTAWSLGVLLQDPTVEASIKLLRAADVEFLYQAEGEKIKALSEWVWPFKVDESSAIRTVISKIVSRLSSNVTYDLAEKNGAASKLDIRLAIPVSIQLYGASTLSSGVDEKFKRAVGLILLGEERGWDLTRAHTFLGASRRSKASRFFTHTRTGFVLGEPANRLRAPLSVIFSKPFPFLKEAWMQLSQRRKGKRLPWSVSGRTLARAMGITIFITAGAVAVHSYNDSRSINSIVFLFSLVAAGIYLAWFWSNRLNQKVITSAAALPVGSVAFVKDIFNRNAVNRSDFMATTASLFIAILLPLYVVIFGYSLGLGVLYLSVTLGSTLIGNILFALNPIAAPDWNPWAGFGINIETHFYVDGYRGYYDSGKATSTIRVFKRP